MCTLFCLLGWRLTEPASCSPHTNTPLAPRVTIRQWICSSRWRERVKAISSTSVRELGSTGRTINELNTYTNDLKFIPNECSPKWDRITGEYIYTIRCGNTKCSCHGTQLSQVWGRISQWLPGVWEKRLTCFVCICGLIPHCGTQWPHCVKHFRHTSATSYQHSPRRLSRIPWTLCLEVMEQT